MNKPERDELRSLHQSATPLPWKTAEGVEPLIDDVRVCRVVDGQCVACLALMGVYDYELGRWTDETTHIWRSDAQLIVTMRNHIVDLLDQLDRYEEALQSIWDGLDIPTSMGVDIQNAAQAAHSLRVAGAALQGGSYRGEGE